MMNRTWAEEYGRKTGCKFYVYNSKGCLIGGFRTKDAAEDCKRRWEKDPWSCDVKYHIEEVR